MVVMAADRQLSSEGHALPVGAVRTSFTQAADLQLDGSFSVVSSTRRQSFKVEAERHIEEAVTSAEEQLEEIEFSLRSVWTETTVTERRATRNATVEWSAEELMPSVVSESAADGLETETTDFLPQADAVDTFNGSGRIAITRLI